MENDRAIVGVAFGGGGVRAGAHIGVLEIMEENNIPVDMVAGTSAGSAVAALYAWGLRAKDLKEILLDRELLELMGAKPSMTGLLVPQGYLRIIKEYTDDGNIEDARMPLFINAADLVTRREIVFDKGSVVQAVHASSALPGLIKPVQIDDMLLCDGGVLNNCPGDILYQKGADVVLSISCLCSAPYKPKNHFDVLFRAMDMMQRDFEHIEGDLVLSPITQSIGVLERKAIEKSYYLGRECAAAHIDEFKEILKHKNGTAS